MSKFKAICETCGFKLTSGEAGVGDICPWCNRGTLTTPKSVSSSKDDSGEYEIYKGA